MIISNKTNTKMVITNIIRFFVRNFKYSYYSCLWLLWQIYKENFKCYIKEGQRDKKLIILANGPSLKNDLAKGIKDLYNADLSVLNNFCHHPIFKKLKPKYYIFADPAFFSDNMGNKETRKTISILQEVDWDMNLYIPFVMCKMASKKVLNKKINIIPYHSGEYRGWECVRFFFYRKGLDVPRPQNVLIPSIYVGIMNGYKKIELYGADHSWTKVLTVSDDNKVCQIDSHFYDNEQVTLLPCYKCDGENYQFHELLFNYANMFKQYRVLRKFADQKGCQILNMTKNSFIDAFKRGV